MTRLRSSSRTLLEARTQWAGRPMSSLACGGLEEFKPGFCFDTCHAHAGGEDLSDVVERLLASVGSIDLVHANNSRDPAGSGRDRHANFSAGKIDIDVLVGMVTAAKAPAVICETPWSEIAEDLALLKERL